MIRVVLDTNVVISALVFRGAAAPLVSAWQSGRFKLLVSRQLLNKYIRNQATPNMTIDIKKAEEAMYSSVGEELVAMIEKGIRYNNWSAKLFLIGNVFLIASLLMITASLLIQFWFPNLLLPS